MSDQASCNDWTEGDRHQADPFLFSRSYRSSRRASANTGQLFDAQTLRDLQTLANSGAGAEVANSVTTAQTSADSSNALPLLILAAAIFAATR